MIFRLDYCNKDGLQARLDITTPGGASIVEIEGTGDPFRITYKSDKQDKSFHFQTTSAEINIYETPLFNIDTLKTSNETQIRVDYYIDGQKNWTGFVIPDFFSREIGGAGVVSMVASDRISTLKGVTLSDLPAVISIRDLAVQCLAKTGLDLTLKTMADFESDYQFGFNEYFRSNITSQRLYDTRGRSISCYDILHSILVASGSKLVQKDAEWHIINKLQHEAGVGRVYRTENTSNTYVESVHDFSEIRKGAIRTIVPVAGSVGIYHEYGGGKIHPDNYDFHQELAGWDRVGGFNASINNKEILGYFQTYNLRYGDETDKNYLVNNNNYNTSVYIEAAADIPYSEGYIDIEVEINTTGPGSPWMTNDAIFRYSVIAERGGLTLFLNAAGGFSSDDHVFSRPYPASTGRPDDIRAVTINEKVNGTIGIGNDEWVVKVRIYGTNPGVTRVSTVNYCTIKFNVNTDTPKGAIYKREQGSDFTRIHDIETTIIGDYLTGNSGLNGYFYAYPSDDTSSIDNIYSGISTLWTTPYFPTEMDSLPLLQHVVRQQARMFSVAHDMVSGEIDMEVFDPLSIFVDCNGKRYVVVSAEFDFLRSIARVDLEEIAYENLMVRDFIYSYFGEGESGISSVGGISAGTGGGGGGGMTSEQLEILTNLADWWRLDEENDAIYSLKSVYSLKGVSALGLGSEGGGGGGSVDMLDDWTNYTPAKSNYYVPASLLVPFRSNTLSRLDSLEAGGGAIDIEIVTTGTGNAITSLTKSGSVITATKGLSFALSTHNHTIAQVTGLQGALDLKASQSDIDTAIDELEIGGRNLIRNSDLPADYSGYNGATIISTPNYEVPEWKANDAQRLQVSGGTSLLKMFRAFSYLNTENRPDGAIYTLSIYVKNLGDTLVRCRPNGGTYINVLPGEAVRVVHPPWSRPTGAMQFQFGAIDADGSFDIAVWHPQIEEGNKATDWTPAPEDQVSDWSTTDVTSFSFIKNKPTTLAGYGITDAAPSSSTIIAGTGLTGGGNLTANRTLSFDTSWGDPRYDYRVWGLGAQPLSPENLGAPSNDFDLIPRNVSGFLYGSNNYENSPDVNFPVGIHIGYNQNIGVQLVTARTGTTYVRGSGVEAWNPWREFAFIDSNITGNAATATSLQNSRTIWGQSFNGTGNVSGAITGATTGSFSASVSTPKVDFGNGFTIEPSGTELVFKYNGAIKQRMLSDGTILATGGLTALATD